MRVTQMLSFVGIAVLLGALAWVPPAYAEANATPSKASPPFVNTEEILKQVEKMGYRVSPGKTYQYTLTAGQTTGWVDSELSSINDWDIVVIVQQGAAADVVYVAIEDLYIMGDTMQVILIEYVLYVYLQYPLYDVKSVTSPGVVRASITSPVPGLIGLTVSVALIHYTACPGGFPAGYHFMVGVL